MGGVEVPNDLVSTQVTMAVPAALLPFNSLCQSLLLKKKG